MTTPPLGPPTVLVPARPAPRYAPTAWTRGYIHRRCWGCNVVYQWPDQHLPTHRARCPGCSGPLRVTSQSWAGLIITLEHQP